MLAYYRKFKDNPFMTQNPHESPDHTAIIKDALGQDLMIAIPSQEQIEMAKRLATEWPGLLGRVMARCDDVELQAFLSGYYEAGGTPDQINEAVEDSVELDEENWMDYPFISGANIVTNDQGEVLLGLTWSIAAPENAPDNVDETASILSAFVTDSIRRFMVGEEAPVVE